MEESTFWEAFGRPATQEFPNIYRTRRFIIVFTTPILSEVDPVHTTPSDFPKIHFNIILPPTSTSS
jgi:hypothetical protein